MRLKMLIQQRDGGNLSQGHSSFQTGQKIMYQGEEGEIVKTHPVLVIKTGSRVACGNIRGLRLQNRFHKLGRHIS